MSSAGSMGGNAGSGLGQAASDLLKEMQKAQTDLQQMEKQQSAGGASESFSQHLQAQPTTALGTAGNGPANGHANVIDVLRQAKLQHASPTTRVGATERVQESKLESMITNLVKGQDKMSGIMHSALSGRQFAPNELLAMQVAVYRFSQELDLTSKVVQQATSGIKQTLNTQV